MAEKTTTNQEREEQLQQAIKMIAFGHSLVKVGAALKRFAEGHGPSPMSTDATRAVLYQHLLNAATHPDFEEVLHAVSAHLHDMAKGHTTDTLEQAAKKAKKK